jgi:hypothetical protein
MMPQGRSSVPEKTPKIFLPARNVGRPHGLHLDRFGEIEEHLAHPSQVRVVVLVHPGMSHGYTLGGT